MTTAVCPGTFDPVTLGHVDIVERAAVMFERVIVAVGRNSTKSPLFDADTRVQMVIESVAHVAHVEVLPVRGLLVDFCTANGANVIVRGLRFAADFDYECQMAQLNRHLSGVETIMLPTAAEWSFVSSTMIREIARLGGDVSSFVPTPVMDRFAARDDHTPEEK